MRLVAPLALLLLALAAPGCGSAEGAFRTGMDLEREGRFEEAALAYVKALRRDPELEAVRGRLAIAGRTAVQEHLTRAGASPSATDAADAYLAADRLIRTVRDVGVELDRPETFIRDMAGVLDDAVRILFDEGLAATEAADYATAIQRFERASGYFPSAQRRTEIADAALFAYIAWAEADLAAGRYRNAIERTDAALAIAPEGSPDFDAIQNLRTDIFDAGTLVAAVFPAESPRRGDDLPAGLLREIDDVLSDDHFRVPPPFLAFVDPSDVRRLLRDNRNVDGRMDNLRLTGSLTRDLQADLGVAVEIGDFVETDTEVRRRDQSVRLADRSGSATFQRVTREIEVRAVAAFRTVDGSGRRVACSDEDLTRRLSERYDVGVYDGDWRALDLSRAQREMFSDRPEEDAAERAISRLRDDLAEVLASRVAACLADQVP
jgi:hypothetical protein